jgi:hypothetical protein
MSELMRRVAKLELVKPANDEKTQIAVIPMSLDVDNSVIGFQCDDRVTYKRKDESNQQCFERCKAEADWPDEIVSIKFFKAVYAG